MNRLYEKKNILFGASNLFLEYKNKFDELNIEIEAVCDNDFRKIGSIINGVQVIDVNKLKEKYINEEINIIITSMYHEEIKKKLNKFGINKNIYVKLIYDLNYIEELNVRGERYIEDKEYEIEYIKNKFGNETSKILYSKLFKYIETYDLKFLKETQSEHEQYFIPEVKEKMRKGIILDCGAFTGDTIQQIIKNNINFNKIISFEAEEKNYFKLKERIEKLGVEEKVIAINKGVGERKDIAYITTDRNSANNISYKAIEKSQAIEIISIDSLDLESVSLIKMDIEGSELAALKGAIKTILRERPILTICVYHSIEEHITIPKFLMENLKKYKFSLEHHSYRLAETVIYCIPNELG